MVNYVNNSFDKVLKPCDAQQFHTLTSSEQTEKLILGHRAGEKNSKAKLPALTYMGVLNEAKYKDYLRRCEEQGGSPLGSRRAEFMQPTGLLMLDFDHVGDAKALYEQIAKKMGVMTLREDVILSGTKDLAESQREMLHCAQHDKRRWELALAHVTPSGDGLRLVLKREKGKSIQQEQYEFCQAMGVKCDDVCKDISRLSFAPMKSEILYFNPSLLFAPLPDEADYPDGSLFSGVQECRSSGVQTNVSSGVTGVRSAGVQTNVSLGVTGVRSAGVQTNVSLGVTGVRSAGVQTNVSSGVTGVRTIPLTDAANGLSSALLSEATTPQLQNSFDTEYNGVPYAEIVRRLEAQLGGAPSRGARNSFIFSMACNLRYICNDDAAWVASILPTYGEDPQKHRQTIQSAINRPMSRNMPETLQRALGVAKMCSEADPQPSTLDPQPSELPPALPSALPEPLAMLVSCTPEAVRPAVAMAVFPSLGAYVKDLRLVYADNRSYEPTFMNILVAEQSAGKSSVNAPIQLILEDIKARDIVHLHQEQEWKERCASISSTQDKPTRPKGLVVQILASDMTNAAFVQRLSESDGHFLYTQMDEIELLNCLKTNSSSDVVSAVLRLAFDCGQYGQVRVAANAVNALVNVRWNWNASSTVQRVRKFFHRNIADGTLSRLSFATIIEDDDDWGEKVPKYEEFSEGFLGELMPYLDRLKVCTGKIHCPEAIAWAEALNVELVSFARDAEERAYARLSRRGILMGFFRAMLLYVMNDMQWTREIEEFATWSVKYDLWCKMRFFRDLLHKDVEGERKALQPGPVGLLSMLPKEFTREQVRDLRIAQGMKPDPKKAISNWVTRGYIKKDEALGVYVKL